MTLPTPAELAPFFHRLADAADQASLPHFRSRLAIDNKLQDGFDPVTQADRAAERVMRDLIAAAYPEHGILGEEHGHAAGASGATWVLDPIDGTKAFITGMPLWGTLIAFNDGERPTFGMMSQPFTRERFWGDASAAWLNGEPIRTRACASIGEAIVMTTSPHLFPSPESRAAFDRIAAQARMVRYGGDCYAYCMLACGLVDAVIEDGLKPYDIQALIPIIEGAGGRITDWRGGSAQHGGAAVAAGDAKLHAWLVDQLSDRSLDQILS